MKVLIVVTHLLGTGHLARALMLARAFQDQGHAPLVVSGGMPAPHLDNAGVPFHQLPPVRSDGVDFSTLLDASGAVASDAVLAQRAKMLCALLDQTQPQVLITELFPFGRRILRAEFSALLHHATAQRVRPLICASIRDILAPPSTHKKRDFAEAMIARFYDAVLCHGDPKITPLDLSWPVADTWRAKLHYTGFVTPATKPLPTDAGQNEIIVSAGGGNVGHTLFRTAIKAARQDKKHTWRLLIGGTDATARIAQHAPTAPGNVTLEPARPDFSAMLGHAACSVSLCGYNTALDVLRAGCPAVFIPFDAGNEVEQGLRAQSMADQPGIEILTNSMLNAQNLCDAVQRAQQAPKRPKLIQALNGAETTVKFVTQWQKVHHAD